MSEEYEIIPINPIRRLEKRVESIEKSGSSAETVKELVDIVRANQRVVDDIVKVNSDMMNKVSVLTASVNNMSDKINDFMSRIEITGESEPAATGETYKDLEEKLEDKLDARLSKLEKRVNALILSFSKTKLRKSN